MPYIRILEADECEMPPFVPGHIGMGGNAFFCNSILSRATAIPICDNVSHWHRPNPSAMLGSVFDLLVTLLRSSIHVAADVAARARRGVRTSSGATDQHNACPRNLNERNCHVARF